MIDLSALKPRLAALTGAVCLMWVVSLCALYVDRGLLYDLALHPRDVGGLVGILGMPFVHGSLHHLLANTVPLLIMGGLLVARGAAYFLRVSVAIALLGGVTLWLLGREAAHIGASGLVFGIFGFLIVRGIYERSVRSALVALVVFLTYGTMIFGILPQGGHVSWEGHLFGLIAGAVVARAVLAIDGRRAREATAPTPGSE